MGKQFYFEPLKSALGHPIFHYSRHFFFLFFFNFKILIFWIVIWVKGQNKWPKVTQNSLSHFISQEPYIIWLSFMVNLCKMMIFPGLFSFFFKVLIYLVFRWGQRAKNGWKWEKIMPVTFHISGNIHHMVVSCGTQV